MCDRFVVVQRRDLGQEAWDGFVESCDEAWFWHLFDVRDAMATWPGSTDASFALVDRLAGDKVVAILPLRRVIRRPLNVIIFCLFESLGGPAICNNTSKKQKNDIKKILRVHLEGLASRASALEMRLMLPAMAPAYRGSSCPKTNPLLEIGCQNSLSQTWVVDLHKDIKDIRNAYSELTKRELKKSQKYDFTIVEASSRLELDAYYQLHIETCKRTSISPHPWEYFKFIFEKLIPAGVSRVLMLYVSGRLVAAQNTCIYKGAALYWTGASISEKNGWENRVLFDRQIYLAKEESNCSWYETGEGFPNLVGGKLKGLSDFKRSFGGVLYPYYIGKIMRGTLTERLYQCYKMNLS